LRPTRFELLMKKMWVLQKLLTWCCGVVGGYLVACCLLAQDKRTHCQVSMIF